MENDKIKIIDYHFKEILDVLNDTLENDKQKLNTIDNKINEWINKILSISLNGFNIH